MFRPLRSNDRPASYIVFQIKGTKKDENTTSISAIKKAIEDNKHTFREEMQGPRKEKLLSRISDWNNCNGVSDGYVISGVAEVDENRRVISFTLQNQTKEYRMAPVSKDAVGNLHEEQVPHSVQSHVDKTAQYATITIENSIIKENHNLYQPQKNLQNVYYRSEDKDILAKLVGKAVIEGKYKLKELRYSESDLPAKIHMLQNKQVQSFSYFIAKLQNDTNILALVVWNYDESFKEYSIEQIKEMLKVSKTVPQVPVSEPAKEIDPAIASYVKQQIKETLELHKQITAELHEQIAALKMKVEEQEQELKVLRAQVNEKKEEVKDEVNKPAFERFNFG